MKIISLNEVIEDVGSQSRLHFNGLLEKRANLVSFFQSENLKMRELIANEWRDLPIRFPKEPYLVVQNEYNFVFRKGSQDFTWLENYDPVHFRNSLLINLVFKDSEDSAIRLNKAIYLLYYHCFMRKEDLIDNLTQSVCFELQELIRLLIEKDTTVYRQYNTSIALDALRWRLTSERVTLLAKGPAPINFRRDL